MIEGKRYINLNRKDELTVPPSIGSKELSFDENGGRVRQIVDRVIQLSELEGILNDAGHFSLEKGATRSVVRLFMNSDLVGDEQITGFHKEAEIPLAGAFSGLSLLYYGFNSPERCSSVDIIEKEKKIMQVVLARQPKAPSSVFEKAEGFSLERLQDQLANIDYDRLRQMYSLSFTTYPFNIVSIIPSMVKDKDYKVYAARSKTDGMLYAVCITEEMILHFPNGKRFIMREMGDSAKMPEVSGLNAPLKLMLINEAFHDGVDLVFCESRAALGAVNAVNHDIGMQNCGFLNQHTRIGGEGIDEKSIYGNMNVWALNKDGIQRIGQEVKSLNS